STVVTFGSHPKKVLLGHSPRTLTSLEHRLELFRRAGIELALVLEFDEVLRSTSAEQFADELLIQKLGTRAFVLGFDSKFGEGRRGTPEFLRARGYDVEVVDKVDIDGRGVSSTAIREAVELGDLESAARMLGRRVSVLGDVIRGEQIGRKLGFPTANLDLHHELHPPAGVYACWVRSGRCAKTVPGLDGPVPAVCNIGFRPTVAQAAPTRPTVEVHLLDFEGDLYDTVLETEFIGRLRSEQRFDGLEALKAQIARDITAARTLLG
ncbi:MAG: riboflavin biosynthesis protein RibF, partial [Planctomycetota bacterium]